MSQSNKFGGQDEQKSSNNERSGSNNRPVFENDNLGVAAWINQDKNNNAYLSIKLSFLGNVNVFPATDAVRDALNRFANEVRG